MAIRQLPSGRWTVPGSSGTAAAGYYVYTYQPGTSTPKATYTDYTGSTANPNPIVLDARGEYDIWWDGTYKVSVYTGDPGAGGTLVWTEDNYGEGTSSVLQGNFNLVLNGSFEQDTNGDSLPDDWTIVEYTGSGGVILDSTTQTSGVYSLKFTSTGSGGGYATSDFFEVSGSSTIPVTFSLISSIATVHNVVDIIWYTSAKAVISTSTLYDDTATNPTSWTDKNYSSIAPATARYAQIRLYGCKDDDAQTGSTWFDGVLVNAGSIGLFPNVNAAVNASDEELNFSVGVTSAIQTQIDSKQSTASNVTGYSNLGTVQIETDYGVVGSVSTVFDAANTLTTSTWETIGKTGSGATHIWTDLDDVPNTAKAIILNTYSYVSISSSASGLYFADVYAKVANSTVSTPTTTNSKIITRTFASGHASAASETTNSTDTTEVFVPITNGIFKGYYGQAITNATFVTKNVVFRVVGWVE